MNIGIGDQIERLNAQYQKCLSTYDKVAFLDLCTVLRVLTEYKNEIDKKCPEISFEKLLYPKRLKKILTRDYVYFNLLNGLTTSAFKKEPDGGIDILAGRTVGCHGMFTDIQDNADGSITMFSYCITYYDLSTSNIKKMDYDNKRGQVKKVKFSEYMQHPAIRFKSDKYSITEISQEQLIKRVANEYHATHNSSYFKRKGNKKKNNRYSLVVMDLMKNHECLGLPVPYFVLLHTAQTILEGFKKIQSPKVATPIDKDKMLITRF